VRGRPAISAPAACVRSPLLARTRRQRRPKDHGCHCDPALFQRHAERKLPCSALGHPRLPGGNGARNAVRRLAHRSDNGLADHRGPRAKMPPITIAAWRRAALITPVLQTAGFGASTSLPRIRATFRSSVALQTSVNATAFDFRLLLAPTEYPTNLTLA